MHGFQALDRSAKLFFIPAGAVRLVIRIAARHFFRFRLFPQLNFARADLLGYLGQDVQASL